MGCFEDLHGHGREAAEAAGAGLAVPEFADLAGEPTDFNDHAQRDGAAKVKETIQAALEALGDTSVSPAPGKPLSGRDSAPAAGDSPAPAAKIDSGFELNKRGLWLHVPEKSPRWISPPLEVALALPAGDAGLGPDASARTFCAATASDWTRAPPA